MATTKRMFSNDIVGSDAFIEMPTTSQALYFHLGMRCDDDGFVNPNVTMRMTGANKNDLDILIGKRFLLPFKNGVVVIKHHRINNNWDSRDSRRTLYIDELRQLFIKDNNAYTFDVEQGQLVEQKYITNKGNFTKKQLPDGNPTGIRAVSDDRIEENRIEENRIEENRIEYTEVFESFWLEYPEKKGKGKAYESWCKIKGDYIKIIESIKLQVKNKHFKGKDGKDYIPHPTTWLNQKRWEDEVKILKIEDLDFRTK